MHLWFSNVERPQPLPVGKENVITLSKPSYNEINEHRIPVEREVLAALANAPGLLGFYVWLAWRSFTVRGHTVFFRQPCTEVAFFNLTAEASVCDLLPNRRSLLISDRPQECDRLFVFD